MNTVFVTGASGCIGSATCRALVQRGVEELVCFSRSGAAPDLHGLDANLRTVQGDITDPDQLAAALRDADPTHVIHLAAYQTPDCNNKPLEGMAVNVGGTAALVNAAAKLQRLERLVVASSSAVYGKRELYPGPTVTTDAPVQPVNLYGYWKVANEGAAQAFERQTGVPTVSVRLSTTYGPGRDRGYTAAPTTAMKHAAAGKPYRLPYTGREHYHFVDDVGAGFAHAATGAFTGYGVINLRGTTVPVPTFCEMIKEAAAEMGLSADVGTAEDAEPIPFICDLDDAETVRLFPAMPLTPLGKGIRKSLAYFAGK